MPVFRDLGLYLICVSAEIVFEIPQEIKPIQVEPSRTIEIVCESADETTPATWYKDDVQITPDGVKYDTTSKERKRSLVLHDVKPEDAGQYVCEVGPQRTVTTLEVTKPEEKEIKGSRAFDDIPASCIMHEAADTSNLPDHQSTSNCFESVHYISMYFTLVRRRFPFFYHLFRRYYFSLMHPIPSPKHI